MKTKRPSRLAIVDHLTGLYNRRYFDERLKKIIAEAKKKRKHFSLLMIDIDKFKDVNDKYGHLVGDKVLNDLAKVLKQSVRRPDICFRYGGDEIAVLLPNTERKAAENIVARLKYKVEKYKFSAEGSNKLRLKLSVGLAIYPEDEQNPKGLIQKADTLLYEVKRLKKPQEKSVEPFILETKLMPPVLKKNVILRPQLLSLFKENLDKKLVIITADAGYGKTTLLTQLIKKQNLPCVFYDLDKGDSDLVVFLSYLSHGLEQIQSNVAQRTKGLLTQGGEVVNDYALMMGTLINELVEKRKQELFIILDDYHTLSESSSVHQALDYFIDHLPDIVHMVIASRAISPLPSLAKWRSKQDLFELSREGLRFTDEEVKTLLNEVYKIPLPEEELKRVSEKTEGWITGIQLILQSAGKDRKTVKETLNGYLKTNQPLFEYFASEIYAAESVEVQDFLKKSSILEIITPNAYDNIFNMQDSASLLKHIKKRNLFLSVIGTGEYKYHHLFREFLQKRIKDEEYRCGLHLKAAKYYQRKKHIDLAIGHYLRSGSYEYAGNLIIQISDRIMGQAQFATINNWFRQIPEEVFKKQPQLLLVQAKLFLEQGQIEESKHFLLRAKHLLKILGDTSIFAEIDYLFGVILWTEGNPTDAVEILRKALANCPADAKQLKVSILNTLGVSFMNLVEKRKAELYLRKAEVLSKYSGFSGNLREASVNLAALLNAQGKKREAFYKYKELVEQVGSKYFLWLGVLYGNAARAALDFGQEVWAEQTLEQGWDLCQHYEDPWSKAILHLDFGNLYIHKAQWDHAQKHLEQALNIATKLGWTNVEFGCLKDLARFYRHSENYEKAGRYLDLARGKMKKTDRFETILMAESGLLETSRGHIEEAEKILGKNLKLSRTIGWKIGEFLTELASAVILLNKNKNKQAIRLLRHAIRLAKVMGYDGILVRELRQYPQLAGFVRQNNIEKDYILSLSLFGSESKLKIRIRCFGALQLEYATGKSITPVWPTEKARSLFAFMIANRGVPLYREAIIEQIWPGFSKNRGSKNFGVTASRLRQCLAKALSDQIPQNRIFIFQYQRYQLFPGIQLQVDTEEFNLMLKKANMACSPEEKAKIIRQALLIYKADYLLEIYDAWADIPREKLRQQKQNVLCWLAHHDAQQGDDINCVSACESYLSMDPLSEQIVKLHMKSLSTLGRMSTIKTCYNHFKQALRKELGSVPSRETEDLYKSLMDL